MGEERKEGRLSGRTAAEVGLRPQEGRLPSPGSPQAGGQGLALPQLPRVVLSTVSLSLEHRRAAYPALTAP